MKKLLTLCMVCGESQVLLGMKKRGFGAGHWNGFGGKVESGESLEEAALREIKEEVGIVPVDMIKMGIINFTFEKENDDELEVHIYRVDKFSGDPVETEEMYPEWFQYDDIPYKQMWSDDEIWLPFLLTGKYFRGRFHFDKPVSETEGGNILEHNMDVVEDLVG